MKILVTGATGFIGGRAVARLNQTGHHLKLSGRGPIESYRGPYDYVQLDLQSMDQCLSATTDVDVVIHCAGKAGAWGSYQSFLAAYSMTLDISDAVEKLGYQPKVTTTEGLEEFITWAKKESLIG